MQAFQNGTRNNVIGTSMIEVTFQTLRSPGALCFANIFVQLMNSSPELSKTPITITCICGHLFNFRVVGLFWGFYVALTLFRSSRRYCIQLWIHPVLFSPFEDPRLIRPFLNSPTLHFSYIILYIQLNWPSFKLALEPEGEKGKNKMGAKFSLYTVPNLWNQKGIPGFESPDSLLHKPRAWPLHYRCSLCCTCNLSVTYIMTAKTRCCKHQVKIISD